MTIEAKTEENSATKHSEIYSQDTFRRITDFLSLEVNRKVDDDMGVRWATIPHLGVTIFDDHVAVEHRPFSLVDRGVMFDPEKGELTIVNPIESPYSPRIQEVTSLILTRNGYDVQKRVLVDGQGEISQDILDLAQESKKAADQSALEEKKRKAELERRRTVREMRRLLEDNLDPQEAARILSAIAE